MDARRDHRRPDSGRGPRDPRGNRDPRGQRGPHAPRDGRGERAPREVRPSAPASAPTPAAPSVPAAVAQAGVPHGSREGGWLPDCVLMGDKVESGLAFFADAQGRITRFSREPADLAAARRLAGQVALPGLVNAHSHAVLRVLRGRTEPRGRTEAGPGAAWRQAHDHALDRLGPEDVFDAARMTFMEMLLAGITCVGEFHYLHQGPAGAPALEPGRLSREVMRAAHDVGIRIALLHVAHLREDGGPAPARSAAAGVDAYLKDLSALQEWAGREYAADEVWVGAAPHSLAAVPPDAFKAIALHARAQRLRLHTHLPATPAEQAAAVAQCGRPPVAFLADQGLVDKRFTAVDAAQLGEDEIRLLGTARATVCVCPGASQVLGLPLAAVDRLLTAGAGVAWGSDAPGRIDAFEDARLLEFGLRSARGQRPVIAPDAAQALLHALTVTGARSLGATGGALEVGRPADFFTVNLFDPLLAGADAGSLPAQVVFGLDRRAVRDVWVGARQRISHGRHVGHGPIVGRFVDLQKRLWPSP